MECTQRLECTQDLYDSPTEKSCPEQIGFLGICGTKYPVKKGPNKIGRDPQTCSIVLQLESISRQHAVINILSKTEFMLMDLDSANKTKLMNKTLQPYIPHPLKNGDTVQFGKIFGIFRLLEEDNELPMTQALDIPDTPVANKHVSRVYAPITTIPESPEVSDRDDSFIAPSQPKLPKPLKNESSNFIKPAAKTISIQPIGSKKIDNVYWNSSKKSTSIGSTFDESNQSLNESTISLNKSNNMDIHEMETQPPSENANNVSLDSIYNANTQMPNACNQKSDRESVDGIFTANTQMPNADHHNLSSDAIYNANTHLPSPCNKNVSIDSIYSANTQAPENLNASPSPIHNLETQMPATDNLPTVCKVNNQQEMEFDFCVANKENDFSTFNAETPPALNVLKKSEPLSEANKSSKSKNETTKSSLHKSEEEMIFEDLDESFEDEFESQSLLPESPKKRNKLNQNENKNDPVIKLNKPALRDVRLKSDSSTDCDDIDIAPTQQLPKPTEDDLTDCEDDGNPKADSLPKPNNQNEMFEDMLTQVLDDELPTRSFLTTTKPKVTNRLSIATSSKEPFEDLLTQVIDVDQPSPTTANDLNFEDMPTQIISNDLPEKISIEEMQTQVLVENTLDKVKEIKNMSNDFISPFKVPLQSPRKSKRKDTPKDNKTKEIITVQEDLKAVSMSSEKYDKYYEATQDILDDLCTQRLSPAGLPLKEDDDVVPCSVEDDKTSDYKLPGLDCDISPKSSDKSSENMEEKLNQFVSNLSKDQIRDVIGVQPLKKQPSDPSDTEATPKKVHPLKFFETDLPDSQEIKTSVSLHYKSNVTESSSESETEIDSEEQFTPILYRKKKKPKVDAKLNLTKKLDLEALPSRVLTRVRKPALKLQDSEINVKEIGEKMLKPKFLTEQEGEISNEIIIENITRLKNKNEKNKSSTEVNISNQQIKNEPKTDRQHVKKTEQILTDIRGSDDNNKIESSLKEKRKLDDNKDNDSKNEQSSKDKRKKDDVKDSITEHSSKEKRKKDDVKDSKTEHSSKDKRHRDNIKQNDSKSERRKREKPKSDGINEEKPVSRISKSKTLDSNLISIDLTSERSKRSTRYRNKHNISDKETDKRSASLDKEKNKNDKTDDDKKRKSDTNEDKLETDKEVRRSRRQKSYKDKKEDDSLIKVKITKPAKKEIKPEKDAKRVLRHKEKEEKRLQGRQDKLIKQETVQHEKSAVYSVSSDSGNDSPKRLKRSATEMLRAPSPKRTRSTTNAASSASSSKASDINVASWASSSKSSASHSTCPSLRSTPAKRLETQRVLFTAFPFEEVRNKLESLGAVIVTDVTACTVLVTLHIKRTFKLLCAVGLGRPIVGSTWVQACADNNCIVDPWLYLLQDNSAEQRFKFSLQRTLTSKRSFLKGYHVSSTPNVKPTTAEMILIVECSGGVWAEEGPNWLCVSCSADKALWPDLVKRGATVVSSELVLGGVLRQKLDIAASKLA